MLSQDLCSDGSIQQVWDKDWEDLQNHMHTGTRHGEWSEENGVLGDDSGL